MDLNRDGWRSVTDDAAGVVFDLAKLRPDLLAHIPMVLYRDSLGSGTRSARTRRARSQIASIWAP